ncbi:radical SAM protein [Elusimicrobiota bacterium]
MYDLTDGHHPDTMADTYKIEGHKLYWHMDRVSDWLKGKRIAPIMIDMGINQTCNLACKFCYYSRRENRSIKQIPTEALLRLVADCAELGTKSISFAGDGEPLMHPGVYQAVAQGAKAGLDMAISTNGIALKHDKLRRFLESLTWLRFSMNAASPATYKTVMGGGPKTFERVLGNIRECVRLKKKHGLRVTIGIQMVLIPDCMHEIVPYARLGKRLGVDYAVIKQWSESTGAKQKFVIDDHAKHESCMAEAEACSRAGYDVIIKRKKMRGQKRKYDHCYGCEFLLQISGAGDVYCCGNFYGNKRFFIGSIVTQSFKDIVRGKRYKQVMDRVKTKLDVHRACGHKCRVNEINEFLWMMKDRPQHINFI